MPQYRMIIPFKLIIVDFVRIIFISNCLVDFQLVINWIKITQMPNGNPCLPDCLENTSSTLIWDNDFLVVFGLNNLWCEHGLIAKKYYTASKTVD